MTAREALQELRTRVLIDVDELDHSWNKNTPPLEALSIRAQIVGIYQVIDSVNDMLIEIVQAELETNRREKDETIELS